MPEQFETREARFGKRMIEVRVRFWTDGIASERKGMIRPRHAWTAGVARITPNEAHGIAGLRPKPFNSLTEIPGAIESLLTRSGVKLHASPKTKKLIATD